MAGDPTEQLLEIAANVAGIGTQRIVHAHRLRYEKAADENCRQNENQQNQDQQYGRKKIWAWPAQDQPGIKGVDDAGNDDGPEEGIEKMFPQINKA